MCNFLSAIFTATGTLICEPVYTDSHNELLDFANIKERDTTAQVQQFVRLELLPPEEDSEKWLSLENWTEHVDEHEVPSWFDKAARFDAFARMRDIISAAITDGDGRLTFGKLLILRAGSARCRSGRVFAWGNSKVTARDSSKVTALGSSTVTAWDSSKVTARGSSTVTALDSSTVTAWDSSKVTAWDSSTVTARGSSTVTALDSSKVTARDSSKVTARGSSTVNDERQAQ